MKRSKISLGLTTAVLALVGVVATKHYTIVNRFYVTKNATWCTQFMSPCICSSDNPEDPICRTGSPGAYPLYTVGPSGTYVPGTNCIQPCYENRMEGE